MEIQNNNKNLYNNMSSNIDSDDVVNLKNKRYTAYDVIKDRDITFYNPYGRVAKRIYRQYIDLGYDPGMIVIPRDLKFYPKSRRFLKVKSSVSPIPYVDQKTNTIDMPIKERSSFKKMLASYTIANTKNIQAYAGIELI
eukprot:SAG11_NODE_8620_length_994_cov_127.629050_1_plen_138_part_10